MLSFIPVPELLACRLVSQAIEKKTMLLNPCHPTAIFHMHSGWVSWNCLALVTLMVKWNQWPRALYLCWDTYLLYVNTEPVSEHFWPCSHGAVSLSGLCRPPAFCSPAWAWWVAGRSGDIKGAGWVFLCCPPSRPPLAVFPVKVGLQVWIFIS